MNKAASLQHKFELTELLKGDLLFTSELPIWNSEFTDDVWSYTDETKADGRGERSNSIMWHDYSGSTEIKFNHVNSEKNIKYQRALPELYIQDIKKATAIYINFPKLLKNSRNTKSVIEPATVKGRVDELLKFFSFIFNSYKKSGLQIDTLQDITWAQMKHGISKYTGRSSHLKRALKLISDPIVQQNLSDKLQWTLEDLGTRSIKWNPVVEYKGIATLPDSMFIFLMKHIRSSIGNFLFAIEEELHDKQAGEKTRNSFVKKYPNLAELVPIKLSSKYTNISKEYKTCKKLHGYGISDVEKIINDVQCSAIVVITLLTGMRVSEIKYVMRNCIVSENGYQFIKSKVVKQKDKDLPINDVWIAVPLIQDAVKVLQVLTKYTENPYLISALYPDSNNKLSLLAYTSGGLRTTLKRWVTKIDNDGIFEDWTFSPHQLRETLVYQLAKAEVGLPFISMQLKHFSHRFKSIPNNVTAGYGEYKKNLLSDIAERTPIARENALLEIYGENSNFAGGAADAHKARIDSFFSGMGLFGESREQYIKHLAMKGVEIMPTSIGGCTKNFIKKDDETKQPPPCYGDYQCDPDCENHLISPSCKPALESRYELAEQKSKTAKDKDAEQIWKGLSNNLKKHLDKLRIDVMEVG